MRPREKFGGQGLVFLAGMFLAFLLAGNIAVTGATASIVEVWSVPISDVAYSVSVSDNGRVALVTDDGASLRVYSSQGEREKNWSPPKGTYFEFCLVRQDYVLGTYGNVVSLFGNEGNEQLWGKSLRDLWPDAVAMSIDSERIVMASYPPNDKSAVWMLDMEGNELWNRQVESNITDTAITAEGFVVAGGEQYGYFADKGRHAVYLFRLNGSLAWWKETDSPVIDVAVSDDCTYIVAGLDNGGMLFLDGDGHILWEKDEIGGWVDLSGDGQLAVAGSNRGYLVVVDAEGNAIWQSAALDIFGYQDGLNISRNGQTIVGFGMPMKYEGNRIFVFDSAGEILYSDTNSTSAPRVAVSESGQFVAIAFGRKLILLRCE
jgi:DNA-binding beta-propeller fold protein YncE